MQGIDTGLNEIPPAPGIDDIGTDVVSAPPQTSVDAGDAAAGYANGYLIDAGPGPGEETLRALLNGAVDGLSSIGERIVDGLVNYTVSLASDDPVVAGEAWFDLMTAPYLGGYHLVVGVGNGFVDIGKAIGTAAVGDLGGQSEREMFAYGFGGAGAVTLGVGPLNAVSPVVRMPRIYSTRGGGPRTLKLYRAVGP